VKAKLFDLSGRWALVTGCSRGLGRATALALAGAGANIVGISSGIDAVANELSELIGAEGGSFLPLQGDLSQRAEVTRLVRNLEKDFPAIDILVNNAGIIRRAPLLEHPAEEWDAVLDVNLTAPFLLAQSVAAGMVERGWGKIIFLGSLLSFQGGITVPGYAASKGAIRQLVMAMSNELAGKGVCVNAIAPGYMATDATKALRDDPERATAILNRIPAGRWGDPEDLDGTVIYLASRASDYVTGTTVLVDGGWMGR
jgi:2-dehydro-3-deoxy-D-gluconate 5-dehydrogenase